MAILVNLGQRGFVLKEGFLNPGDTLAIDTETAEKLMRMYPKELKLIQAEAKVEAVKVEVKAEEPKVEEPKAEAKVVEAVAETPKKRTYKRKAK